MSGDIDFRALPANPKEWRALADQLAEQGDAQERHYLEVKSDVDLNTKAGRAKVAKFLLGAANRLSSQARRAFDGHAIMVLGVSQGSVAGIPSFESHELQDAVTKFIGDPGPQWDHHKLSTEDGKFITFIVADPPVPEGRPWYCRASDGDKMQIGDVYIRADGATRKASPTELMQMTDEAKQAQPAADFEVTVLGTGSRITLDPELIDDYIRRVKEHLTSVSQNPSGAGSRKATTVSEMFASIMPATSITHQPDGRTWEEFLEEIDRWEAKCKHAWPGIIDKLIQFSLPAIRIRVRNLSNTYVSNLKCTITPGVRFFTYTKKTGSFDPVSELPDHPEEYGPKKFKLSLINKPWIPESIDLAAWNEDIYVDDDNDGAPSSLSVSIADLGPEEIWTSTANETILVLLTDTTELTATWKIVAPDHHRSYTGTTSINVAPTYDLSIPIRQALFP